LSGLKFTDSQSIESANRAKRVDTPCSLSRKCVKRPHLLVRETRG